MNIEQMRAGKPVSNTADPAQKLKLQKAVREFESVFVGYMLKSMRNTVEKADNPNEGFGGEILESMFDVEMAKHMSKNSSLGLAQLLYRKMTGEDLQSKPVSHVSPADAQARKGEVVTSRKVERLKTERLKTRIAGSPAFRPEPLVSLLPQTAVRDAVNVAKGNIATTVVKAPKPLHERLDSYARYIAEASEKHGVSDSLIRAVIAAESHAKPNARSHKDAKGLMQLIDSTAAEMGVRNVWDPRENILGGAKYLKHLLERFDGDEKLALAGYNAGPANVVKHGGVPPFKETKQYVARVMNFVKLFEQQGGEE